MRESCFVTALHRIHESDLGIIIRNWCTRQLPAWLVVASLLALGAPAYGATLEFVQMLQDGQGAVNGMSEPEAVTISPDGAHVYVGSTLEDAVAIFDRNASDGTLSFVDAVFNSDAGISGLNRVRGVAVSPDGAHVYTAAFADGAVVAFSRDATTGLLTFLHQYKDGSGGISSFGGAHGLTMSPDGAHLYVVAAQDHALTVLARDPATGLLTLVEAHVDGSGGIVSLAGAETVAVSPDGAHVYVAAQDDRAVTVFSRNAVTGALTLVEYLRDGVDGIDGLNGVQGVTVTGDGKQVLTTATADNALAVFDRDPITGALTSRDVYKDGIGGVDGLQGAEWVTVSPSGAYVYVASDTENAMAVFSRDPSSGTTEFLEVHHDGVGGADGLGGATSIVTSPDGEYVYVTGFSDNSVAVYRHLCGNGMFDPGEECDDGNTLDGDCCSSTCMNESAGSPCTDDGNVCTDDKCNGVGLCLHVNNTASCEDGDFCTVGDTCASRVCQPGTPRDCSGAFTDACLVGVCDETADACVPQPVVDGTACDDADACTQTDGCVAGICVGGDPVICGASDQCHGAGVCDSATGACSDPALSDGTPCDDGNACTLDDACLAGVCVGGAPVICMSLDQCHDAGTCDPATGQCSNPSSPDGTGCDDGNACTQTDACVAGACAGADPVVCQPSDQCHVAGVCDPATGMCSDPPTADGTGCNDGNACTQVDTCQAGICAGADPIVCTAIDQCHLAGVCDSATGTCSNPDAADGTACDDGNACTESDACVAGVCVGGAPVVCTPLDGCHVAGVCDPATGECSDPQAADGTACDDGNACTQADACASGVCVGADPVVCTALDQCHAPGVCDPSTGLCSDPAMPDGTTCDDGSACTQADACLAGACVGADPVVCPPAGECREPGVCDPATGLCSNAISPDMTPCDDGNACTMMDICLVGLCVGGQPMLCEATDACHVAGVCDPETGVCSSPEAPDGTACDDGSACTQSDACEAGVCVGADPIVCTAQDQCHVAGLCDAATGVCSNPPADDATPCDDSDPCTQTDTCQAGVCVGADPVVCAPSDPCHAPGVCDSATGLCSDPAAPDGTACDDGNGCTVGDSCQAGVCVSGSPVSCTPIDDCHTAGVCDPATGACSAPVVVDGTSCDDGSACTRSDACEAGVCVGADPIACTALDQCHVAGVCDPATGACSDPAAADGAPCDDGDACTHSDTCQAGTCVGGDPMVCTALDACHVAGECDPATGACSAPVAVDGTGCDDGDACTQTDVCQAGACIGTNPVVCVAVDACHVAGECDPATGTCSDPAIGDGAPCDDGDACTQTDSCQGGICVGTDPVVCTAAGQCRAAGTCDSTTGICSDPPAVDGAPCDDGDACTQADSCQGGVCVGADAVICTALDQCHVAGVCDPATGSCSDPAVADGTLCDDGDACTQTDSCEAGVCVGSAPVVCTALDGCHEPGVCDPATGACSDPLAADGTPCDDGDGCTQADACMAGACVGADPVVCTALDACHAPGVCDPATGLCSNPLVVDGTACDDGNACTQSDACQGGVCVGADPVVCEIVDQCQMVGVCDPATGLCSMVEVGDGAPCEDGNGCTLDDACQGGVCVPGSPVVCTALDQCHGAGTCDPATGVCSDPALADGAACDDGNGCTRSDACVAGLCVGADPVVCTALDQCHAAGSCDPTTGLCSDPAMPDGTGCDDGDACTRSDTCEAGLCVGTSPVVCTPLDQCHGAGVCNSATGQCSDPALPDGAACDDGNGCTQTDTCAGGVCTGDDAVVCEPLDACHDAGVCDPATGTCSNPARMDGYELVFAADADTYTDEDLPDANFGLAPSLRLDGKPLRRLYLRFDVSDLGGMPIARAMVRLHTGPESNAGGDHGGDLYLVSDNNWGEETLTDANRPPVDGPLLSSASAIDPAQLVEFDVTAAVSGTGFYSFALEPGSNNMALYASREGESGGPELIVLLGTLCDDGNACTRLDLCEAGSCVGVDTVTCTALDQCHDVGVCDPATGICSNPEMAGGTSCDDGAPCTEGDACSAGVCAGTPVVCQPLDQCHGAGACDPATGACSDPALADGTACDDGDGCTQNDVCVGAVCVGGAPVECTAGPCHGAGECDPATGACSMPPVADGSPCDDGAFCTVGDACAGGVCEGAPRDCAAAGGQCTVGICDEAANRCAVQPKPNGVTCDDGAFCTVGDSCQGGTCRGTERDCSSAGGQCTTGVCDEAANACRGQAVPNGTRCEDGNRCTEVDVCRSGVCMGGEPVVCTAATQCHDAGTCDPATGQCSNPMRAEGSPCDDGDVCSVDDVCTAGLCVGQTLPDADGDGFCDAVDLCPGISDPTQADTDGDGVGDVCQCTSPVPGNCIAGGGSKRTDCLLEFTSGGPLTLNKRGTKIKRLLRCADGDPACDLDGARDGQCTFGVSLCFGNADPRYPRCGPSPVRSAEVLRPSAVRGSETTRSNALRLETALSTLGVEVRRRKQVIADAGVTAGTNLCTAPIRLQVDAPTSRGKKIKQKFKLLAQAISGRKDKDSFTLQCE